MDYIKYNLKEGYKKIYNYYELNNHLMTLGLDIYWRKKASNLIYDLLVKEEISNRFKFFYCDFCIGTGEFFQEMVGRLQKVVNKNATKYYIGLDFSFDMLKLAKYKKIDSNNVYFILADVLFLPFKDGVIDAVSISLGIRNLKNSNDVRDNNLFYKRFKEIYRVIVNDGYFWGLETSRPPNKIIRKISDIFTLYFATNIAKIVSWDFDTYTYLAKSMIDFFEAPKFAEFLVNIGFKQVNYYYFTFGVVALHIAKK